MKQWETTRPDGVEVITIKEKAHDVRDTIVKRVNDGVTCVTPS